LTTGPDLLVPKVEAPSFEDLLPDESVMVKSVMVKSEESGTNLIKLFSVKEAFTFATVFLAKTSAFFEVELRFVLVSI
jgi:hypothetical protein